jgi:DMSO reductase anchor subunit
LIGGLLAVFITEIIYGAELIVHWHNHNALDTLGNLIIASLFIGVARAWEFVGDRDTGIWASIAVLATGREHPLNVPGQEAAELGDQAD